MKPAETITLAADFPLHPPFPVQRLLDAFAELADRRDDVHLLLTGKRFADSACNVINFAEQHGLEQRIDYRPYYQHRDAPDLRRMAVHRIPRATPPERIDSHFLEQLCAASPPPTPPPEVLFVTAFHPLKQEGNSAAMRVWIEHLKRAGYVVHLLYYREAAPLPSDAMRSEMQRQVDHYYEVAVESPLANINQPPLNVDLDDWCGPELLTAVDAVCDHFEIADCIVNYAFDSGVFLALPPSTRRILLTHDRFADRNRTLQAQGFRDPAWVSLTSDGEKRACQRADLVVALQHHEAEYFADLTDRQVEVAEVPPFFAKDYQPPRRYDGRLRIGYFGSPNALNEQSLARFIDRWERRPELVARSRILVAGGASKSLGSYIDPARIEALGIELLGRFDQLGDFLAKVDLVINPESGGTGIKIKTLETLAHGCPLLSTRQGMVGLHSDLPGHQAGDLDALLDRVAELADAPQQLATLAAHGCSVYDDFWQRSHRRLAALFPPVDPSTAVARQRVTIIIPFTDDADDLQARLDSTSGQDYPAIERLLVDLGRDRIEHRAHLETDPPDDPRAARQVAEAATRPGQAVASRLAGPADADGVAASPFDQAVQQASGDYLLFLPAGQRLLPAAVAALVDAATLHRVTLVIGAEQGTAATDRAPLVQAQQALQDADDRSLPVRFAGLLIHRRLFAGRPIALTTTAGGELAAVPLLFLLAGRVACIDRPVFEQRPTPPSRLEPCDPPALWRTLDANIERLELQRFRGDLAAQFLRQLLARPGAQPGRRCSAALLPLLEALQTAISQASAPARRNYAQQLLAITADSADRDTARRLASLDSRRLLLDHYREQLSALSQTDPR